VCLLVVPNHVNSPTVQTITDYATTLTAKLNGSVVFQESFSGPLSGSGVAYQYVFSDVTTLGPGTVNIGPAVNDTF